MVNAIATESAVFLNRELDWFCKVLDTRIKLHFGQDSPYSDIFEITPPALEEDDCMYCEFLRHYEMSIEERLIILLALTPHIKPRLLDVFLYRNSSHDRPFTEFGGRSGQTATGFLPSGETAMFLLAGDDLSKRLTFNYLFEAEHVFSRHQILELEQSGGSEPELSGVIALSKEVIDLITVGVVRKPRFGPNFPAKLIETQLAWDDLVLDAYTSEQILEIRTWIEYGDILLNGLGLGRKLKPGYRSLFYGPPGTGKTLTASLLGKVNDLDVYRIDLSMVISKYIGETEKNLENIFRKAEHKNWILFFDEAEALFGKRTNITDSHDKFANQEVSYLLQRVEDYDGVVVLCTNQRENLDEAFTRRFQSIIHFPMPQKGERLRIWEKAFSPRTPLDGNVNLPELSEQYKISGGSIMNVVRYATLMALRDERRVIRRQYILDGIRKEFQKEGKTF